MLCLRGKQDVSLSREKNNVCSEKQDGFSVLEKTGCSLSLLRKIGYLPFLGRKSGYVLC